MPTKLICEWCEKSFYSKIRSLKQRFCSRDCFFENRKNFTGNQAVLSE